MRIVSALPVCINTKEFLGDMVYPTLRCNDFRKSLLIQCSYHAYNETINWFHMHSIFLVGSSSFMVLLSAQFYSHFTLLPTSYPVMLFRVITYSLLYYIPQLPHKPSQGMPPCSSDNLLIPDLLVCNYTESYS